MTSASKLILVDSAAFVAWFYQQDQHHQAATKCFEWIEAEMLTPVTTSYIIDETATVLSHRQGQGLARQFLTFADDLEMIFITDDLRQATLDLFQKQEKRGTSMVDCSNVIVMQHHAISTIFSYDKIFEQEFKLQVAQ